VICCPRALLALPYQPNPESIDHIGAIQVNDVRIAPFLREAPTELKHANIGEDGMIEEATEAVGVMDTKLKSIP